MVACAMIFHEAGSFVSALMAILGNSVKNRHACLIRVWPTTLPSVIHRKWEWDSRALVRMDSPEDDVKLTLMNAVPSLVRTMQHVWIELAQLTVCVPVDL